MQTRSSGSDDLTPFDSEIEATARRQRGRRRRNRNKRNMVDLGTKSLLEYGIPDTTTGFLSIIVRPPVTAQSFELKPQFI